MNSFRYSLLTLFFLVRMKAVLNLFETEDDDALAGNIEWTWLKGPLLHSWFRSCDRHPPMCQRQR